MLRVLVVATESAGTTCCIVRKSGATVFILAGTAGGLEPHLVTVDRLASLALYTYYTIGSNSRFVSLIGSLIVRCGLPTLDQNLQACAFKLFFLFFD